MFYRGVAAWIGLLGFAFLSSGAEIVINEVHYHPASETTHEEFIELFNRGTNSVNLLGWRFTRGVDFTFTNDVQLDVGHYLVVAANLDSFNTNYPGVTNVVGGWVGRLSNRHEDIELENELGDREDLVHYASEGDWGLRQRSLPENGIEGWEWFAEHDGLGKTLERRNSHLPNANGQNWGSSVPERGTPGRANSIRTNDLAPLIEQVAHAPIIPNATQTVTVTARLTDELTAGVTATLFYRIASVPAPGAFQSIPMLDDGQSNDGGLGDGLFGARVPAQTNSTVIEFYVQARDDGGLIRTWPAAARQSNGSFAQTANALYQVDEGVYTGPQPVHRLVLTESERQILASDPIRDGNAQMNGTLITSDAVQTQVRYTVGVRIRGAGSRNAQIPNYRVNIPSDRTWNGVSALNHNAQFGYSQVVGNALALKSSLPAANVRTIQVRVNGANLANSGQPQLGAYALSEVVDSDWAQNHFPKDPNGNIYSARRVGGADLADLTYLGANYVDYINRGYSKNSNTGENEWSDLIDVTAALAATAEPDYDRRVRQTADPEEWMRYFAFFSISGSGETSLGTGFGDDYNMYAGELDRRILLLPHDLDTILNQGQGPAAVNADLFRATAASPAVAFFLRHPQFVPTYFAELKRMTETTFSAAELNPLIDRLLGDYVPLQIRQSMKDYAVNRNAFILSQIPQALSATTGLPITSGYPRTATPTANLNGRSDAIRTRSVRVNGQTATWTAWQASWTIANVNLLPGINRILIQSFDSANREFDRTYLDIWYDDSSVVTVSGSLAADATWTANLGPYVISNSLTVPVNRTLTIQPGTSIYFTPGASLTINGRLLAEGTDLQRIRFTAVPGPNSAWNGIQFQNTTQDNRIVYADIALAAGADPIILNNSQLLLDHVAWTGSTTTIIELNNSSLLVRNCVFPTIADNETIHGNVMPANGYVIIQSNYFGGTTGYSDIIDFTGGQRPGPILQVYDNVFNGGSDDALDLDGTDAHIEGNHFLNIHQDAPRDSGSYAIATDTGADITVVRNIFYNNDHALLLKNGARATFHNNTVFHLRTNTPASYPAAVISFGEPDRNVGGGAGADLDGNIFWDIDQDRHFLFFTNSVMTLAVNHSILSGTNHPGTGNLSQSPEFHSTDTNRITASSLTTSLALQPGSPAMATGPNGLDMGALVPAGASIAGEPLSPTASTDALLTVAGPGITHYRWRLDNGAFSAELPVGTPIVLTSLTSGSHSVAVIGKNSASVWQPENKATLSRPWVVNTTLERLVINEILALNRSAVLVNGEYPDLVELQNAGATLMDLGGLWLSDDPTMLDRYVIPPDTLLGPGEFLLLIADNEPGPGLHLGFGLNQEGDALYLSKPTGELIDSITFGIQAPDFSIGRFANGAWSLTLPTPGAPNQIQHPGNPAQLRLNEWLAAGDSLFPDDFVELYNLQSAPVSLAGLALTDEPVGDPRRHVLPPLSFIGPNGHIAFLADGQPGSGNFHLNFQLTAEQGRIALVDSSLVWLDCVSYGPQSPGASEGRRPDGSDIIAVFGAATQSRPSPGGPNPGEGTSTVVSNIVVDLVPLQATWRYEASGMDLGSDWRSPGFSDQSWSTGQALLYNETNPEVPFRNTFIPFTTPQQTTFYFRYSFVVQTNLDAFQIQATYFVDDGAVVYLDGVELFRVRMPAGPVAYSTFASDAPPNGDAITPETRLISGTSLPLGTHELAVEVHQQTAFSTDLVWGMALQAVRSVTNLVAVAGILNEVLAANQNTPLPGGAPADYIEIYNPQPSTVNMTGLSLTDDPVNPRRWIFPNGVVIPSQSYLLIRCDPNAPASTMNEANLNTGFGLDASGDAVYLFDRPARGGTLLDSIGFGVQTEDFSLGRLPSNVANWGLNLPTPGGLNIVAALGSPMALRINEWMAIPDSGDDWFELYNPNNQPVALGGLHLTDNFGNATKHPIAPLSFVGSQSNGFIQFIADNTPQNGADHVGFRLDNSGEELGLATATGQWIDQVSFPDPILGVSEGRLPDGAGTQVLFPETPTPRQSNYLPLRNVLVHEVLSHSDLPLEDAIELHNLAAEDLPIGGWFLSDSQSQFRKFRIPDGTVIAAGGFVVFYEYQFNPGPEFGPTFALNSGEGDQVYLSESDVSGNLSGYRDVFRFGPSENGQSFGRYETSTGFDVTTVTGRTFGVDAPVSLDDFRMGPGLSNAPPRVGPIVLHEILYHPPEIGGTNELVLEEFIELHNFSAQDVTLHDPARTNNTWRLRGGVDFDFATGTRIPAGGFLVLVSFDPSTNGATLQNFRAAYGLDMSVSLAGPFQGRLNNDHETLELRKPDEPQEDGSVPYVAVDKVEYQDSGPWPSAADTGFSRVSIQRVNPAAYGNDPVSWLAGLPTPGALTGPPVAALPAFTLQPLSQSVLPGSPVTFQVQVMGASPLQLQWRFNGVDLPNQTNSSLTLPEVQIDQAGLYSVRAHNPAGAALSQKALLQFEQAPIITQHPQDRVAAPGTDPFFSVAVQGSKPLSYYWFFNGDLVPGQTNAVLTLENVSLANEGSYSVLVSNQFGVAPSGSAMLLLNEPPMILTQPVNLALLAGRTATFTVTATGSDPLGFQWRFNGLPLAGQTSPTLELVNVQPAQSGLYSVLITNLVGRALSDPATLTVVVPPVVTIASTVPGTVEGSPTPAVFTISRTGDPSLPLDVSFNLSGTASPGMDYLIPAIPTTVPSGDSSVQVTIQSVNDGLIEAAETVVLSLIEGEDYVVGASTSASATIEDDDNQPPMVGITTPANGAIVPITPTNVMLSVNAQDPDGTVASVAYYNHGSILIGQTTVSPFSLVWTNPPLGTNLLTAIATDTLGRSGMADPVVLFVNYPPSVAITHPPGGSSILPGTSITLQATAADADGLVTRVDFYDGATLLGTSLQSPYQLVLPSAPEGTYRFLAAATDDRGMRTFSPIVPVRVRFPSTQFADFFDERGEITGITNNITSNNSQATREQGEPPPMFSGDRSLWLTWRAPYTGICVMETFGSAFDTVLTVFTNDPPTLQTVANLVVAAQNDDYESLQSLVFFEVQPGMEFHIRVEGFGTHDFGFVQFHQFLVSDQPRVLYQPPDVIALQGATTNLTAFANALQFFSSQWYFNGNPVANGTNMTLTISNLQPEREGLYFLVVSNNFGSDTSRLAQVSIGTAPVFVRQPFPVAAVPGDTVIFKVEAVGTMPIGYRWRRGGTVLSNQISSTLVLSNVQSANAGTYSALASNPLSSAVLSRTASLTILTDTDSDHIPDNWETNFNFSATNPNDAGDDTDDDGMSNLAEYKAGTHPRNGDSFLKIDTISNTMHVITLTFQAVSNRSYSVLAQETGVGPPWQWQLVTNVAPNTNNRTLLITDPVANHPRRFYYLVTPELP